MRSLFVTFAISLILSVLMPQMSIALGDVPCSGKAQYSCRYLRSLAGTTLDTAPLEVRRDFNVIISDANTVVNDIDPGYTQEVTKEYIVFRDKFEANKTEIEKAKKKIAKTRYIFSTIQKVVRENIHRCLSNASVWSACLAITLSGKRPRLHLCGSRCGEESPAFWVDSNDKLILLERFLQEYTTITWGSIVDVPTMREQIFAIRTSASRLEELLPQRDELKKKLYPKVLALLSLLPQLAE